MIAPRLQTAVASVPSLITEYASVRALYRRQPAHLLMESALHPLLVPVAYSLGASASRDCKLVRLSMELAPQMSKALTALVTSFKEISASKNHSTAKCWHRRVHKRLPQKTVVAISVTPRTTSRSRWDSRRTTRYRSPLETFTAIHRVGSTIH